MIPPLRWARALTTIGLVAASLGACASAAPDDGNPAGVAVEPVSDPNAIADPGHRADAQGVAEVTAVIGPALARGDGKRACSLMAASAQERLSAAQKATNCVDATTSLSASLSPTDKSALKTLQVARVSVKGTSATATLASGSGSQTMTLLFGATTTYHLSQERGALQ